MFASEARTKFNPHITNKELMGSRNAMKKNSREKSKKKLPNQIPTKQQNELETRNLSTIYETYDQKSGISHI